MTSVAIDPTELTALSGIYRLLARLWLREIDEPIRAALRHPPLSNLFEQAGGRPPEADIDELAIDFCRLFVGPSGHLPPYQSVWQRGQFQSQATTSMQDFAELIQYDFSAQFHVMMPDHAGLQMDVMGSLLERAAELASSTAGDSAGHEYLEVASVFFERHLTWLDPLLIAADRRATTSFYRAVIALTRGFLESEQHRIGSARSGASSRESSACDPQSVLGCFSS